MSEFRSIVEQGIDDFYFERDEEIDSSIEDSRDEYWEKLMKTTTNLKMKYPFLEDFMKINRINVVKELEFSEEMLNAHGEITHYEDDVSGTIYYVVNNKGEIKKLPYKENINLMDLGMENIEFLDDIKEFNEFLDDIKEFNEFLDDIKEFNEFLDDIKEFNDFNGEKVGDFIDGDTRYILRHDKSDYGNDQSPLYVISCLK